MRETLTDNYGDTVTVLSENGNVYLHCADGDGDFRDAALTPARARGLATLLNLAATRLERGDDG